jgi:hypothetical protein
VIGYGILVFNRFRNTGDEEKLSVSCAFFQVRRFTDATKNA